MSRAKETCLCIGLELGAATTAIGASADKLEDDGKPQVGFALDA